MQTSAFTLYEDEIRKGHIIPYLGPGVVDEVTHRETGEAMPATSYELILAMNNGRPMAPRLMYEFPRAAMNVELKRGRGVINRFLTALYHHQPWSGSAFHSWLASLHAPLVIDTNRDTLLQQLYQDRQHLLICGCARVSGTYLRFRIFHYRDNRYTEISQEDADISLPVLFKPLGTPVPEPVFIASDADYVDYLTELMGGFAIPGFIKAFRRNRQYLVMGLRLTRDTERMLLSNFIIDADEHAGWVFINNPEEKERRFCERQHLAVIQEQESGQPVSLSGI